MEKKKFHFLPHFNLYFNFIEEAEMLTWGFKKQLYSNISANFVLLNLYKVVIKPEKVTKTNFFFWGGGVKGPTTCYRSLIFPPAALTSPPGTVPDLT